LEKLKRSPYSEQNLLYEGDHYVKQKTDEGQLLPTASFKNNTFFEA